MFRGLLLGQILKLFLSVKLWKDRKTGEYYLILYNTNPKKSIWLKANSEIVFCSLFFHN